MTAVIPALAVVGTLVIVISLLVWVHNRDNRKTDREEISK
jgi:hypothetical protein